MTNGEKFKEIFEVSQVDEGKLYAYAWLPNHNAIEIPLEWWNAEYKEPKTGHWIFDEMLDRNYYCSECKSMGVDYWDYCPYCGCQMVEPQESEDKE